MIYEDEDFVKVEMQKFNSYLRLFTGEEPEEDERTEIDLPTSDSVDFE